MGMCTLSTLSIEGSWRARPLLYRQILSCRLCYMYVFHNNVSLNLCCVPCRAQMIHHLSNAQIPCWSKTARSTKPTSPRFKLSLPIPSLSWCIGGRIQRAPCVGAARRSVYIYHQVDAYTSACIGILTVILMRMFLDPFACIYSVLEKWDSK